MGWRPAIFTSDMNKALTLAHAIEAGTVWVNFQHGRPCRFCAARGQRHKGSGFGKGWGRAKASKAISGERRSGFAQNWQAPSPSGRFPVHDPLPQGETGR